MKLHATHKSAAPSFLPLNHMQSRTREAELTMMENETPKLCSMLQSRFSSCLYPSSANRSSSLTVLCLSMLVDNQNSEGITLNQTGKDIDCTIGIIGMVNAETALTALTAYSVLYMQHMVELALSSDILVSATERYGGCRSG